MRFISERVRRSGSDARPVISVRPLEAADRRWTEALGGVPAALGPYAEIVLPRLEAAFGGGTREARGLAASSAAALLGVTVFGEVAGTADTARLHLVAVMPGARRAGVARALLNAAASELTRDGSRRLMAEIPDDPALGPAREFLLACGFEEEGRIPDFYRDGVALVFLRRRLDRR